MGAQWLRCGRRSQHLPLWHRLPHYLVTDFVGVGVCLPFHSVVTHCSESRHSSCWAGLHTCFCIFCQPCVVSVCWCVPCYVLERRMHTLKGLLWPVELTWLMGCIDSSRCHNMSPVAVGHSKRTVTCAWCTPLLSVGSRPGKMVGQACPSQQTACLSQQPWQEAVAVD